MDEKQAKRQAERDRLAAQRTAEIERKEIEFQSCSGCR